MEKKLAARRTWAERLFFLLLGALATLVCVELMLDKPVPAVEHLRERIYLLWLVMLYALLPRSSEMKISPATSGTAVVAATGLAAAAFLGRETGGVSGVALAMAIGLLTLVAAWFLFRFASKHAGEIGEARFVTTNRDAEKSDV